jgi:tetratricopeptide (TPR) repeat protein
MNLNRRRTLFHETRRSNLYRVFIMVILILAGVWIVNQVNRGQVKPLFLPTSTPTRTAESYATEGDDLFAAGKLEAAITAYGDAVKVDPSNADVFAKLARIQTYSSSLLTTDAQRRQRLAEALQSIDQAVALAPDDSTVHAIRSLVLDWSAGVASSTDERQSLMLEAEQAANRALQLDSQNVLAQAFFAEILVDQQKWTQAEQVITQAVERDSSIMDVHRVYAYVLESTRRYRQAIEEYQKAITISPNLTFLYISVGLNYRTLAISADLPDQQSQLYDQALSYFAMAANLNKQLEIQDPLPYVAIAKTYSQKGDFFAASLNIKKALEFDSGNADLYGQMGIIYFKARNYESSIYALQCAVEGCTADESCLARYDTACDAAAGETGVAITGLELSNSSLVYYYTYGSVLAAFGPRDSKYCTRAVVVLNQVQAAYGSDSTTNAIVADGLSVCASVAQKLIETPTPYPTSTPLPTPRP